MIDLVKKMLLIGVGLASMTREKLEEIASDLVKKGELTEKEGRELIDEMMAKSKDAKTEMESWIEKLLTDTLNRLNIPTRKDIQELKQRIAILEKENVDRLERERDILDKA